MTAMHRQALDFAHPQPAVRLNRNYAGPVLLVMGLLSCVGLVFEYTRIATAIEAAEGEVRRLARHAGPPRQMAAISRDALAEEIRRANQAASQLTIPWDELFEAVESANDEKLALLSLQPNFPKRELKIAGEAASFEALRAYSERLGAAQAIAEVRLLSHEVVTGPRGTVVRFELSAGWRVKA